MAPWLATAPVAAWLFAPGASASLASRLAAGVAFGWVAALGLVAPWVYAASVDYFGWEPWQAAALTLAVPWAASLVPLWYGLAFAATAGAASRPAAAGAVLFAAAWTAAELARATVFGANPWMLLGHSAWDEPWLRAWAAWTGVEGLSWVMALVGALIGVGLVRRRSPLLLGAAVLVAAVFAGGAGLRALAGADLERDGRLDAGLLQTGVGGRDNWRRHGAGDRFGHLLALSRSPLLDGVSVLAWPENAVSFLLSDDAERLVALRRLAEERSMLVAVGAPRSVSVGQGRAELRNSVYLFAPGRDEPLVYDKVHLLPFIERLPDWYASDDFWRGAYSPGPGPLVWTQVRPPLAPLVCWEAISAPAARQAVAMGAQVLLNLSNDSWFDAGAGPAQHLAMTVFRAVENGRPLLRASTTGISAVIDSRGDIVTALPRGREAVGRASVGLGAGPVAPHATWLLALWIAATAVVALRWRRA